MTSERAAGQIDQRLGERIRARRLAIGLSQELLAERLGVTFQQVQKYEKGINRIAASRLFVLAAALEMSVPELLDGIASARGKRDQHDSLDAALSSPGAVELLKLYSNIAVPAIRRRVLDLVRAMSADP
jgi:transcriptional regulator with XRE-family HTH domain